MAFVFNPARPRAVLLDVDVAAPNLKSSSLLIGVQVSQFAGPVGLLSPSLPR
jgi:hypothetical protein